MLSRNENGSESVTQKDIDRRAAEIAQIEDRPLIPEDREQARRELNGEALPPGMEEDHIAESSLSRDPSDPMVQRGHQAPTVDESLEENDLQKLVIEGVEEAQHDQMLASRQQRPS